jgi:hypothetical protein
MHDLVSLINVCYLQEQYIADAYWSCKRQLCKVPTEAFIYHDNCLVGRGDGPATARNTASRFAKGNWLLFNDGDNYLPSNFIQTLWEAKEEVIHTYCDEKLIIGCPVQFISGRDLARISNRPPGVYELQDFQDSVDISISSLFPAAALDEVGGFEEKFTPAEDVEFWIKLMKKGYRYVQTWGTCLLKTNDGLGLTLRTPKSVRDHKFQMINQKHGLHLQPWEVI